MRTVEIVARVSGGEPAAVFDVLTDFERYPELTDAVRQVTVSRETRTKLSSAWEVNFRHGILKWTEADEIDFDRRVIRFNQLSGDLEHFAGAWHVEDHPDGCLVRFIAEFDLGMPSLAQMLDPVAESALHENVSNIIRGLIDEPVEISTSAGALADMRAA